MKNKTYTKLVKVSNSNQSKALKEIEKLKREADRKKQRIVIRGRIDNITEKRKIFLRDFQPKLLKEGYDALCYPFVKFMSSNDYPFYPKEDGSLFNDQRDELKKMGVRIDHWDVYFYNRPNLKKFRLFKKMVEKKQKIRQLLGV